MKTKNYLLMLLIFLFGLTTTGFVSAQTAAELERVLAVPAVTCAQAARFTVGYLQDDLTSEAAFALAVERGWLNKDASPNAPINLGQLSFLMMKAFNLKGGLAYSVLPGRRYAFRAMVSNSFIEATSDPASTVSGERFFIILGRVLNSQEERR